MKFGGLTFTCPSPHAITGGSTTTDFTSFLIADNSLKSTHPCIQVPTAIRERWKPSQSPSLTTSAAAAANRATSPSSSPATRPCRPAGWPGRWCPPATHSTATASPRTRHTSSSIPLTIRGDTSPITARYYSYVQSLRLGIFESAFQVMSKPLHNI